MVLAVLALSANMAMPALRDWVQKTSAESQARRYLAVMQLGRQTAVLENRFVILCGSASGEACDGDWTSGAMLFMDANGDGAFDGTDRLLRHVNAGKGVETVTWRAFGSRNTLRFNPLGTTDSHNGSFRFCTATREVRLVVNRTGRFRLEGQARDATCQPVPAG